MIKFDFIIQFDFVQTSEIKHYHLI